ncbi:hypothetical protein BX286_2444 [Streptomyces sp. 3211.6]|nr:hypothetical protein BX286_2444 [Streptomyces sp. 3211.6]
MCVHRRRPAAAKPSAWRPRAEHLALVPQNGQIPIASPPSASITARSVAIRPGSWPVPRGRSTVEYAAVSPVASARSSSKRAPACPTTPDPSVDTTSRGSEPIAFTQKVPFSGDDRTPRQGPSSQLRDAFLRFYPTLSRTPTETARLTRYRENEKGG